MKTAKFVQKYISTLEHFIEQSGWPIRMDKHEQEEALALTAAIPALVYEDGLLSRDKKKNFPDKILAEFWKLKYNEASAESNKLYSLIDNAYNKANS